MWEIIAHSTKFAQSKDRAFIHAYKVSSLKTGILFCLFNVKLTNIQYRQIGLFDTGKIHSTFGETLHVRSVWLLRRIKILLC